MYWKSEDYVLGENVYVAWCKAMAQIDIVASESYWADYVALGKLIVIKKPFDENCQKMKHKL